MTSSEEHTDFFGRGERTMRRKDRAATDDEAKELLRNGEYGVLSTVSQDGHPYGVPVNYVSTGEAIYFHCAPEGHKLANIEANRKVSFCVVGKTEVLPAQFGTRYESVIITGDAFEETGEEKRKGFVELLQKYSPAFMKEGLEYIEMVGNKARVFKIAISSISGKARK